MNPEGPSPDGPEPASECWGATSGPCGHGPSPSQSSKEGANRFVSWARVRPHAPFNPPFDRHILSLIITIC